MCVCVCLITERRRTRLVISRDTGQSGKADNSLGDICQLINTFLGYNHPFRFQGYAPGGTCPKILA